MHSTHSHKVNLSDVTSYIAEFATFQELMEMHSRLPNPNSAVPDNRIWTVMLCNDPIESIMRSKPTIHKRYEFKLVTVIENGKTAMRFVPQFKVLM